MAQPVVGYASKDSSGHLSPFSFTRRATGVDDVTFKITHCGICHSDLHQIKNEWGFSRYPMVPGHEIVGVVIEIGSNVQKFKIGDHVGVGCMVGSCGACDQCNKNEEQLCKRVIWTYGGLDVDGSPTYGGYSNIMVANQRFVVKIPSNLPLDEAAPLLCAGITVYSPMKHFNMIERGAKLGVVGLGGLGHMAIKFGKAFGLEVIVISTSPQKEKEAKELLGADHFIVSKDEEKMKKYFGTLDYIIDTVASQHPINPLAMLLKPDGKMVLVGLPEEPLNLNAFALVFGRRTISGSCIGGMVETQEMLDFCGEKNITSIIEKISVDDINTAMDRLRKSDVKYRFVLDIEKTLKL